MGGGAIMVRGSGALSETAEAVDKLPYMRLSMVFSNNQKRCSRSCCALMMVKRCIDAIVSVVPEAGACPIGLEVNSRCWGR